MGVAAEQGETRRVVVIELLTRPVRGGMAVIAVFPLTSLVYIIRSVTTRAGSRYAFVVLTRVARHARKLEMFVGQCESGLVMVEVGG